MFAGDGTFLRTFGGGLTLEPQDVALDGSGRVFVADSDNDRVAVFSSEGAFLFAFGVVGEGKLAGPTGIAVEGSTVFVADNSNKRIAEFSDTGTFDDSFEPLSPPRDVTFSEGVLYVVVEKRIEVYTAGGEFLRSFGDEGVEKLDKPVAVAAGIGQIFVADQGEDTVERFEPTGTYLGGLSVVADPSGLAIACGGNLFVVEQEMFVAQIQRFGEPGTPAPPCVQPGDEPIRKALLQAPSNRFHFAGLVKNRANGFAVLYVRVPGPGKVQLKGRGFRRLSRTAPRAKKVRLPIKPKVRLRHFLKQHGKGRIRAEITFTPIGGVPRTLEKVIVLRRKRH